ncbi:MAG: glycosyltransferase family 9 protein [Verrucomicrobiales bacterium]|nr:glycosyltransferase family 9 protein [Verrucomicrobiales bacterium]
MNVKALQRADQWLGVPLCFALTLWRAVLRRAAPPATPPRSILFVKLAEQGSTVLAWAALRRAVEMVGRDHVYFLVLEENRFILDVLDVIPRQNVIPVAGKGVWGMARSALGAIRRVRRLQPDAAIDLEFFSRGSAALTFLSGASRRVGFHAFHGGGPYRGDLMTHRLIYNPHLHTCETFLSLVEALRRPPDDLPAFDFTERAEDNPPPFVPGPEETEVVRKMITEAGARPPLILLNPNASDLLPLRRWPAERYVELARRLLERYPEVRIGLTGAPNEAAAVEGLCVRVGSPRCVSFAGRTTLRQLLVLYTLAEVLVTNDSGPAHFATLTPIHVVTLFGPETPRLFAARTPRNTVLWAGLACSPCVSAYNNRQSPCRNNLCMQAISVERVFAEVCRAYEARRNAVSAASA